MFNVVMQQRMLHSSNDHKVAYLKQFFAVRGLWCMGFKSITDTQVLRNPLPNLIGWMNHVKAELKLLFPSKFTFEPSESQANRRYVGFFNSMLAVLALKVEKTGKLQECKYRIAKSYDTNLLLELTNAKE